MRVYHIEFDPHKGPVTVDCRAVVFPSEEVPSEEWIARQRQESLKRQRKSRARRKANEAAEEGYEDH